jgi:hypothetical protein
MAKRILKNALKPSEKEEIITELIHYGINRACRFLRMSKSVFY